MAYAQKIQQLRGFLGLMGYYRSFIENYTPLSFSLTELLEKDAFFWTDQSQKYFEQ